MNEFRKYALFIAWVIAMSGLLISIYYGEVLNFEPCRLCWYQRIAIAPLALFLGIAAYRSEKRIAIYALPFALFGFLVAFYQSLIKLFPKIHNEWLCGTHHCDLAGISPFLGLMGFGAICVLIWMRHKK